MKTSELHTLKSVLTEGIRIDGEQTPLEITCLYIPKIQRAYAQGRHAETDIRKDFLDALFDVLTSPEDKTIELSFLFGSKQKTKSGAEGFELLDGQQRATTLFLLYWYIGMKENKVLPDFLTKFTYETRDTSIQFLINITDKDSKIDISKSKPSDAIRNNKWFTDDYYCDPTVCAMLTMLDAIDEQYKNRGRSDLFEKLERLRFYVLMLEKFDMNDELYIKMNSRGLPLIPFENFKASLVKFMKASDRKGVYGTDKVDDGNPFWFTFVSKMDAEWIDIFWVNPLDGEPDGDCSQEIPMDDFTTGVRYFNFINRYLFTKAAIVEGARNDSMGPLSRFFYEVNSSERLKDWDKYEQILKFNETGELKDSVLYRLSKVLDVFKSYGSQIEQAIASDPFGRTSKFKLNISEFNNLHERVAFAAVTEFIENIPEGMSFMDKAVQTNFKRMLRVAFNLLENTNMNDSNTIRRIQLFHNLCSTDGAVNNNFYRVLASQNFENRGGQLFEEYDKAREMFDEDGTYHPEWEKAFIEAERHPFFKGSVLFFFTEKSGDAEDFSNRYSVVKELFDKNGIAEEYRTDHILLRALLSRLNSSDKKLINRYITEESEENKYLKNLFHRDKDIRDMFCSYFDCKVDKSIKEYLYDIVENAMPADGESTEFKLVYSRLVTSPTSSALFDWVSHIEKSRKKRFKVENRYNSNMIHWPGCRYDRIILDTERNIIIPSLVRKYSLRYVDNNQKEMLNGPIHDSWGWSIDLYRDFGTPDSEIRLVVSFRYNKVVDFYIYGKDVEMLAQEFEVPLHKKHEDYVQLESVSYQLMKDIKLIEDKIDKVVNKINSLHNDSDINE